MNQPETEAQLYEQMQDLVTWITEQGENPECWPLTQDAQIAFVRKAFMRARTLKNSKPFAGAAVVSAAVAVAPASVDDRPCRIFIPLKKRPCKAAVVGLWSYLNDRVFGRSYVGRISTQKEGLMLYVPRRHSAAYADLAESSACEYMDRQSR